MTNISINSEESDHPYIIVCDVDGTIADCNHRRPHLYETPKNWDAFNSKMGLDSPVTPLVYLINFIKRAAKDGVLLIVSGRDAEHEETTRAWLSRHDIAYDRLYMRPLGDRRDDQIIKQEILTQIIQDFGKPDIVFEDRDRVVEMWRSNGILCAQVAPGNF
jgi:hypothetical protein